MSAPKGPLAWYGDVTSDAPFAGFYDLDPSENPTVRPEPAAEAPVAIARVEGESHLVVIARRRHPIAGRSLDGR